MPMIARVMSTGKYDQLRANLFHILTATSANIESLSTDAE